MSWCHRDAGTIEPVGADGYPDEEWIARAQRCELQNDVNAALTAAGLPAIGYEPIEVEPVSVRDIEVER